MFCLVTSLTVRLTYIVVSIDMTTRVLVMRVFATYVGHRDLLGASRAAQTV